MNITKEQLENRKAQYEKALKNAEFKAFNLKQLLEEQENAINELRAGISIVDDMINELRVAEEREKQLTAQKPKTTKKTTKNEA